MDDKVALIDADSLIYINCYNKKLYDKNGDPIIGDDGEQVREVKTLEECTKSTDKMIKDILKATSSTKYLLFLTVGKGYRYDIYKEYKGNRKGGEKPDHFDRVKEHLIVKHKAVYNQNLEADDLVNIYHNNTPYNSFIASPDKDMLKLKGSHYNYSKFTWHMVTEKQAELFFWTSMITGDGVDNIKGVPGRGPKYAESLLVHGVNYPSAVLLCYIDKFGEEYGIYEFYKNYKCLKIIDKYEGLEIMPPLEVDVKKGVDLEDEL
jgi:5'-3' exonuclease